MPNTVRFFFDLETNGCPGLGSIHNTMHNILSVALTHNEEQFYSLVQIKEHIPLFSSTLHGIDRNAIKNAPTWKQVWGKLKSFIRNRIKRGDHILLFAHNLHGFDLPVLARSVASIGGKIPSNWQFVDTLPMFRHQYPNLGRGKYTLSNLYKHFIGSELEGAHDALNDTMGLQRLVDNHLKIEKLPCVRQHHVIIIDDTQSICAIRGIGETTERRIGTSLSLQPPITVGQVRCKVRSWTPSQLSKWIRTILRQWDETYIFSITRDLLGMYHIPDWKLYAQSYPFENHTFDETRIQPKYIMLLLRNGIRSIQELHRHRVYTCCEKSDIFMNYLSLIFDQDPKAIFHMKTLCEQTKKRT